MAYVATNAGPSTAAPTHGSRTLTITNGPTREDVGSGEEGSGTGDGHVVGTLRLRARRQAPRVTWTEDVVDNEGMGKKKSKICCIYNKPKRFDESSDESSSDSDGDSDSSCGGHGHGHGHDHRHARLPNFRRRRGSSSEDDSSNEGGDEDGVNRSNRRRITSPGQGDLQCRNGDAKVHELSDSESDVNAYERPPSGKGKKGKGKGEDHAS